MQAPRRPCVLMSQTEGVKRNPFVWQTLTFAERFACILATLHQQIPQETLCLQDPERVPKHVAYTGPAKSEQQSAKASFPLGRRTSGKSKKSRQFAQDAKGRTCAKIRHLSWMQAQNTMRRRGLEHVQDMRGTSSTSGIHLVLGFRVWSSILQLSLQ